MKVYVYTVKDDSMAPKYRKGDRIYFYKGNPPKNGDPAIVTLKDGRTFVRFWKEENGTILLSPLNIDFDDLRVRPQDIYLACSVSRVRPSY